MTVKLEPRRQFAVEYSSQHNAERWPRPRQYLRVGPTRLLSFLVNSQRCESFRESLGGRDWKYLYFHPRFVNFKVCWVFRARQPSWRAQLWVMLQSLIFFPGLWNWRAEQWTVSIMAQGASSNTLSHSRATSPRPESHLVGRNLCWRPLCFTSMRSHSHHYFPLSQQSTCSQRILAKLWWNGVNIAEFSNEMSFLSFRVQIKVYIFSLQSSKGL